MTSSTTSRRTGPHDGTTSHHGVRGVQVPRIMTAPVLEPAPRETAGGEFIRLAESAGLHLDPWQQLVLNVALAEDPSSGRWRAYEVALIVARQNGKGSIAEALELGWAFLLGEKVLHTSQLQSTSTDAYERLLGLIKETPHLARRLGTVRRSADEFSISTTNGGYIRFGPRSGRLGRGVQYDKLMLDEALFLTVDELAAQLFTMGTRDNPQLWFMSSAGMVTSDYLRSLRDRGREGGSRMAYFEWSVPEPEDGVVLRLDDVELIAMSNPSLAAPRPKALALESVLGEAQSMKSNPEKYYRERFSIFDEPAKAGRVITAAQWEAVKDSTGQVAGAAVFAVDVEEERDGAAIDVCGWREDDLPQVEVVQARTGQGAGDDLAWVVDFFAERRGAVVALAANGPAGGLVAPLEGAGCRVVRVSDTELGRASMGMYDAVKSRRMRHLGDEVLGGAVEAGRRVMVGDGAWRWSRKASRAASEQAPDQEQVAAPTIAPLVSATLALHVLTRAGGERVYPGFRRAEHVVHQAPEVSTEMPRYWALKLGYLTPTVWQSWVELPDGTLLLEHELYRTHARLDDLAAEVVELGLPRPQILLSDAAQDERRPFERGVGRSGREPQQPLTEGVMAVQKRLADGRLLLARSSLVGRDEELARAARPVCTADEVPGYVWDEEREVPCDQGPGLDCARWVVAYVDLRTRSGVRFL